MSYLVDIIERKRMEVRRRTLDLDLALLRSSTLPCTTKVLPTLRRADDEGLRVIAEFKRRSPSKGVIRDGAEPALIATEYAGAGASAISVLTDGEGFGGSSDDLSAVVQAVNIPVLCKDFIVSPMQVFEARSWGADIVLLIAAALSSKELASLHRQVLGLGMTALVEVHDAHEVKVAVDAGAQLIGVNNRDLHTFQTDIRTSLELVQHIPDGVIKVAESGIRSRYDMNRLRKAGFDAVLVGETLMSAERPGDELLRLRGHR
ncbi:MAG: indole-3-glycerol phosphate synthase TrpC [Myxococcota bacterium]|nr:indole-3-glycerol phosphate synthase TrpC [Myxococcota bacterium]